MKYGQFIGEVITKWEREADRKDREMSLQEDFSYIDPAGLDWMARRGRKIDGASIPPVFWGRQLGAPFVGDYRRASVVHDIWCQDRTRDDIATHRMFYSASRCDGVSRTKGYLMYAAIRLFGPRWGADRIVYSGRSELYVFDEIEREIEDNGHKMTLEEVDSLIDTVYEKYIGRSTI